MHRVAARRALRTEELRVAGLATPVTLRRHPAARRLTLRVSQADRRIVVTTPPTCEIDEVGDFVSLHLDWVKRRLADLPPTVNFEADAIIPFRGTDHRIRFVGGTRCGQVVWLSPVQPDLFAQFSRTTACADAPLIHEKPVRATRELPAIFVSGLPEHAPRRLRDWLLKRAREDVSARVAWHSRNLNLRPKRITVRDQTTRWGSCSSTGALSFSWRLIFAPPAVLDYLAAHEVAHLEEMNHGPRFWALVRATMPDYELAKDWLYEHGATLHSYDR